MFNKSLSHISRILQYSLTSFGLNEKRCALCREPYITPYSSSLSFLPSSLLCPNCAKSLPYCTAPKCKACGIPLEEKEEFISEYFDSSLCPACKNSSPPWQGLAYYGLYNGKLRESILALKYTASLHLSLLFCDLLLECSKCLPRPDLLIPVPVSTSRLKIRGYNQALEIARCLSAKTSFPVSFKALYRVKDTAPQEGLNAEQRKKNLQNIFQATSEVKNRSIWLLDDVMTTGSTLAECSKTILAMGAKSVSLLFIARTV